MKYSPIVPILTAANHLLLPGLLMCLSAQYDSIPGVRGSKGLTGLRGVRLSCRALLHREWEVIVHSLTQRHHSTALSNTCMAVIWITAFICVLLRVYLSRCVFFLQIKIFFLVAVTMHYIWLADKLIGC